MPSSCNALPSAATAVLVLGQQRDVEAVRAEPAGDRTAEPRPRADDEQRAHAASPSRAATNARTQVSTSASECAADSCTRMRALPCGTTG